MSYTSLSSAVMDHPALNSYELSVLLHLKKFADNVTHTAYPSYATLAERCHVCKKTVIKAITSLREKGIIARQHQLTVKGDYSSNLYTLYEDPADWHDHTELEAQIVRLDKHGNRLSPAPAPITPTSATGPSAESTQLADQLNALMPSKFTRRERNQLIDILNSLRPNATTSELATLLTDAVERYQHEDRRQKIKKPLSYFRQILKNICSESPSVTAFPQQTVPEPNDSLDRLQNFLTSLYKQPLE